MPLSYKPIYPYTSIPRCVYTPPSFFIPPPTFEVSPMFTPTQYISCQNTFSFRKKNRLEIYQYKSLDDIKTLIETKADINEEFFHLFSSKTPLDFAIERNNDSIIDLLLKNKANIFRTKHDRLLYWAIKKDKKDIVQLLLAKIDINEHVFAFACENGSSIEMIKLLIEKGADTIRVDRCLNYPICLAIKNNHTQIVDLLLQRYQNIEYHFKYNLYSTGSPLYFAIKYDNENILEKLLESKMDPNEKVYSSILHDIFLIEYACTENNTKAVSMLLKYKANVNLTKNSKTVLHIAIENKNHNIIKLLVDAKANIHEYDGYIWGKTPLQLATNDETITTLLQM